MNFTDSGNTYVYQTDKRMNMSMEIIKYISYPENILTKMCKFNKIINHKGTLMET